MKTNRKKLIVVPDQKLCRTETNVYYVANHCYELRMSIFRLTRRLPTLQPAASAVALRLKHRPLLCSTLSTRTSCVASCLTKTCQKKSSPNLSLYRATPRGSNTSWPPGMVAKPSVVLFNLSVVLNNAACEGSLHRCAWGGNSTSTPLEASFFW